MAVSSRDPNPRSFPAGSAESRRPLSALMDFLWKRRHNPPPAWSKLVTQRSHLLLYVVFIALLAEILVTLACWRLSWITGHWLLRLAFDALVSAMASTFTVWVLLIRPLVEDLREEEGKLAIALESTEEAERQLIELNARLQSVLDSSTHVSIISVDLQGAIRIFNTGAERMLGYERDEAVGSLNPAALHLESEIAAEAAELTELYGQPVAGLDVFMEPARRGACRERIWTYARKDGSRLKVNVTMTPLRDAQGEFQGFLAIATDVTPRLEAEDALRRARDELEERVRERTSELVEANAALEWKSRAHLGLARLAADLIAADSIESANQIVLDTARELVGCQGGFLAEVESQRSNPGSSYSRRKAPFLLTSSADETRPRFRITAGDWTHLEGLEPLLEHAIREKTSRFASDAADRPLLIVPSWAEDQWTGLIVLSDPNPGS